MTGTAISLPRALDLRSIQQSLSQVSTRLAAIEKALSTTTARVGQSALNASQSVTSITNLAARIAALEGARASAVEIALRADSAVALFDVVYATSPTGCATADAGSLTSARAILGVAENAAAANATLTVRRFGNMTIAGAGFTPGEVVYWGAVGFTHVPAGVPVAIPVGVATGTSSLFVLPDWPSLIDRGPYTELELFVPVAYALVQFTVELVDTLAGQPDGIVVKVGNELQTRAITAGAGVTVTNGSGAVGNPRISAP